MYRIINRNADGTYTHATVSEKPDPESVSWFSESSDGELVPHVNGVEIAAGHHNGVLSSRFREIQHNLFVRYYDTVNSTDLPYAEPYSKIPQIESRSRSKGN